MGQAISKQMRDLQIEVYEGGKDAGLQLVGRSDWGEFQEIRAGSQQDPLEHQDTPDTTGTEIGMSGEMTVAVGADGQLVNQARHRRSGDAASTHLLKIDVRPTVIFGEDRNVPLIRWVANATVFELNNNRVVIGEESGDVEEERRLAGKRPIHEYGNDPKYRAALPGMLHETPREAVTAVLRKISSDGVINLPDPPDPPTTIAATPVPVTNAAEAGSGRPGWLLPLLGVTGVAAVIIALLVLIGGGDSEAEPAAAPIPTTTPTASTTPASSTTPSAAPTAPAPSVAIAVPEPPIASTTTSTTTTTTTEPPVIDSTIFEILDYRCFIIATGEPGDNCLRPIDIARSGSDPSTLTAGLADGAIFGPGMVATLSLFLAGGDVNDLLVECTTLAVCQTWAAPSFFNIQTEWFPVEISIEGDIHFLFSLINRADDTAAIAVPSIETADGTMIPAGEYKVNEGAIFVEQDGQRSITLFATEHTFWF